VVWSNTVTTAHDSTSATGLWASPAFGLGRTFPFTFTNAGEYPYICAIHIISHPEQTGLVSVVTLANVAPTVSFAAPADGTILTAPASFSLDAEAFDRDGSVSQVEFFNGAVSVGVDTTSPYSVPISNLAAGNYTFSAVATDNLGATATDSINVVVNSPPQSVTLVNPVFAGNEFRFSFNAEKDLSYDVLFTDALDGGPWQTLTNLTGSGSLLTVTNKNLPGAIRFYRVESK
jgi:Bacterial Ig domain